MLIVSINVLPQLCLDVWHLYMPVISTLMSENCFELFFCTDGRTRYSEDVLFVACLDFSSSLRNGSSTIFILCNKWCFIDMWYMIGAISRGGAGRGFRLMILHGWPWKWRRRKRCSDSTGCTGKIVLFPRTFSISLTSSSLEHCSENGQQIWNCTRWNCKFCKSLAVQQGLGKCTIISEYPVLDEVMCSDCAIRTKFCVLKGSAKNYQMECGWRQCSDSGLSISFIIIGTLSLEIFSMEV